MRDAVAVIAEQLGTWETPFVELDIFGTADPERAGRGVGCRLVGRGAGRSGERLLR